MRWGSRPKPTPLEALDCGSQSTRSVRKPSEASEAARLMAVVVLPTPPFWLATAITLPTVGKSSWKRLDHGWNRGNGLRAGETHFLEEKLCNCRISSRKTLNWRRLAIFAAVVFLEENVPRGTFQLPVAVARAQMSWQKTRPREKSIDCSTWNICY